MIAASLPPGVRVTPSVYTTVDEVDLFADRVIKAIRQGLA